MLTVPHTRTVSVITRAAAGWPVTSNATSTPCPSVHPLTNRTGSASTPITSRPSPRNSSIRYGLTSLTMTRAPRWRDTIAMRAPMGPPPSTSTESPDLTAARRTSCVATASGSIMAAWSSPSEAGTWSIRLASTVQ